MGIADYLEQKNKERVRRARAEDAKKVSLGVIIGAAVGASAGLLLAPKSGKETREDLGNVAKDAAETVKIKTGQAVDTVKAKTDDVVTKAKTFYSDRVDSKLTNIGTVGDDADLGDDLNDLKNETKDAAHDVKNETKDAYHDVKNEAKDAATDVKNQAKDTANDVKNEVKKDNNKKF